MTNPNANQVSVDAYAALCHRIAVILSSIKDAGGAEHAPYVDISFGGSEEETHLLADLAFYVSFCYFAPGSYLNHCQVVDGNKQWVWFLVANSRLPLHQCVCLVRVPAPTWRHALQMALDFEREGLLQDFENTQENATSKAN
jgi:hypothetical protein